MKNSEIQVGGKYATKVGGVLVAVIVVRETSTTKISYGHSSDKTRTYTKWVVARCDTGTILPKPRPASALRKAS